MYHGIEAVLYALVLRDICVKRLTPGLERLVVFGMILHMFIVICKKCFQSFIYVGTLWTLFEKVVQILGSFQEVNHSPRLLVFQV